ncbi:acyltransferase [Halanaerobacter jeridensis]|uniref:Acetyltransferase-like isoleucine patch superfamily enzyme n=1 Tax=Halanaerobacter jeridensis TaxID=706427 RepID=A0A938XU42_9FIRM|nr:DapH/DapD/GlmU-related protein [Halanaerobacter jeridensis]MBM7556924.1 acetyltransferase-like isoleucine patch superfamily enzyme [Halanaerobacter jeridensis]
MSNYKIYPNVELGSNVTIEDYCVIGKPPKGREDGELKTIIGDNAVIRSNTIVYAGNKIGDNFQTGHQAMIRENNMIGNDVSVGTSSCVEHHVIIEDEVRLHSQVFVPEHSKLKEGCWIGPNAVLTNAKYPQSENVKENLKGAIIETNAKVGANVTLLPGIVVGKNSLVGSGSVIVNNVPEGKVVVGNPGQVVKDISDIDEYKL